jgi:AcrR family transcriptional regulator
MSWAVFSMSGEEADRSVCSLHHTDLSVKVKPMIAKSSSPDRRPARERLLAAADELFYEEGVNLVGIDRVIERAGVAKASLYDCFGSKEELIRSYLQQRHEARQVRLRERLARYATPKEKILAVFDSMTEAATKPDFRGCAFARASAEARPGSSVKAMCDESRAWNLALFADLAKQAGAADPDRVAQQLRLLYDGASVSAHVDTSSSAAAAARAMAEMVLDQAMVLDHQNHSKNGNVAR